MAFLCNGSVPFSQSVPALSSPRVCAEGLAPQRLTATSSQLHPPKQVIAEKAISLQRDDFGHVSRNFHASVLHSLNPHSMRGSFSSEETDIGGLFGRDQATCGRSTANPDNRGGGGGGGGGGGATSRLPATECLVVGAHSAAAPWAIDARHACLQDKDTKLRTEREASRLLRRTRLQECQR